MQQGRPMFMALRVRDYQRVVEFYRDIIGVPLREEDHGGGDGNHAECSWSDPYFHFAIFPAATDEQPTKVGLSLGVKDVDAVHARAVAAGIQVVESPGQKPWGLSAVYLDPDGNGVGITEYGDVPA